jgi:hypothetical protein
VPEPREPSATFVLYMHELAHEEMEARNYAVASLWFGMAIERAPIALNEQTIELVTRARSLEHAPREQARLLCAACAIVAEQLA